MMGDVTGGPLAARLERMFADAETGDGASVSAAEDRKARGAFFTPAAIAEFLAAWAIDDDPRARVLDPTCGEAVFLLAAGRRLRELGVPATALQEQVYGVDLHRASLQAAEADLSSDGLDAHLIEADFFSLSTPRQIGCPLPLMDAVIGNPPFVRYQEHAGENRRRSARAALAQGVRLSGLASSWAASLVHASAFLHDEGRLAMVLPAELLTVHYAEPVRRWLRQRFASVSLVMFDTLQFADALEKVVLLIARGTGGCESFSLYEVTDAADLTKLRPFNHVNVTPAQEGKWTEILLPQRHRQLFRRVAEEHFVSLDEYGTPELGTVTGANGYFMLNEETRLEFGLEPERHVIPTSPPGTKHLRGLSFSGGQWSQLRDDGEPVWLLRPTIEEADAPLHAYLAHGEALGVPSAYKCQVRSPWWRPPTVEAPDLFFTYMSHRYPRLVANGAGVTFVNSMHGVRLRKGDVKVSRAALPLLVLNSVTMLGAELFGRSYGGGVLKMEPREAAVLPVPSPGVMTKAWQLLRDEKPTLDLNLRAGRWTNVVKRVDEVLLRKALGLTAVEASEIHDAARMLRARRLGRESLSGGDG